MKDENENLFIMVLIYAFLFVAFLLTLSVRADAQTTDVENQIIEAALDNGIDPSLALAMAEVESKFDERAVGSLGEIGLFQLRPEFHPVIKGQSRHNVEVAMKYLAELQSRCGNYGDAYFVCFNYGTKRKLKHPRLFPYYRKVKLAQAKFEGIRNVATRD